MPLFPHRILKAVLISILLPVSAVVQEEQDRSIERQFWHNEPVRIKKLQLKKGLLSLKKSSWPTMIGGVA
jgi:hypothetical protein